MCRSTCYILYDSIYFIATEPASLVTLSLAQYPELAALSTHIRAYVEESFAKTALRTYHKTIIHTNTHARQSFICPTTNTHT